MVTPVDSRSPATPESARSPLIATCAAMSARARAPSDPPAPLFVRARVSAHARTTRRVHGVCEPPDDIRYDAHAFAGILMTSSYNNRTSWHSAIIKRRSRVLRRRTRQAALDKPRVHDGQLGFAILEQKASVTAENHAFEEKQPLVFFTESCEFMDSWWSETSGARIWSWRRRWGEGSQNMALYDSADWACGQGEQTFDGRRSSSRALSLDFELCCPPVESRAASAEVPRSQHGPRR